MEEKVFHRAAVAAQLDNYIEARLHTDQGAPAARWRELIQELAQTLANPTYVIVDPRDDEVLGIFEGGAVLNDAPFIAFLEDGWSKSRTRKVARVK